MDSGMVFQYIIAICHVSHTAGHRESSEFKCPVDRENKTKINVSQQQGSANSYAKRYALANALNLSFGGEDDDGQAAGTEYVNEDEAANIEALLTELDADRVKFLKWCKAPEGIAYIRRAQYPAIIARLDKMRSEK